MQRWVNEKKRVESGKRKRVRKNKEKKMGRKRKAMKRGEREKIIVKKNENNRNAGVRRGRQGES